MSRNAAYYSCLLRVWQVQSGDHLTWVASIQSPSTGELRSFPNIEALMQFLQDEFGNCEKGRHIER
jgi:hypothetical protein